MKLLKQFQTVFEGNLYRHRSSTHGDRVAQYLYEDLYDLNQSPKFRDRLDDESVVLGSANRTHGVKHRRGDGSLGPIVPGESAIQDPGFDVARGSLATIQIGVEVKILAKAMIKQIDRVVGDLKRQAEEFRRSNPQAIAVGLVGVNHACSYRSVEGDRVYETGRGKSGPHPIHEAPAAILRLDEAKPPFDEFLILRFGATIASRTASTGSTRRRRDGITRRPWYASQVLTSTDSDRTPTVAAAPCRRAQRRCLRHRRSGGSGRYRSFQRSDTLRRPEAPLCSERANRAPFYPCNPSLTNDG